MPSFFFNNGKEPKMNTIIECVKSVPDPRRGNHRKHELCDMLFASLASVLCGYDSYVAFARFADLNLEWMRGLGFAFGNGVPSHDAFRYAFSVVDHGLLSACLRNVSGILRDKARKGSVSIDGKALRRCMDRGGKTPISLSVQMCKCASGHRSVVSTSTSIRRRRLALETGADR